MPRRLDLISVTPSPPTLNTSLEGFKSISSVAESNNSEVSSSSSPPPFSSSSSKSTELNPISSLLIIAIILTIVIFLSASLHILLRYINRQCRSNTDEDDDEGEISTMEQINLNHRISSRRILPEDNNSNRNLIDSLPLFSFDSITGLKSTASLDCAVCLSKFEKHDQLRLLPICCHAFHSTCIDTWLLSNRTCPLCRSTVHVDESDGYQKILSRSSSDVGNESFRLELGSVSHRRRHNNNSDNNSSDHDSGSTAVRSRSYSMGSFDYFVEDASEVVVVEPTHRRGVSENVFGGKKEEESAAATVVTEPPLESDIAAEVGGAGGRGWLLDYVDKIASSTSSSFSSRTLSFRISGRVFTGSSRRSEGLAGSDQQNDENTAAVSGGGGWDLEGNKYGEEISSFLRWLSGV